VGDSLVVPAALARGSAPVDARGAVTTVDGRGAQTSLRVTERGNGGPVLSPNGTVMALALRRGRNQTNLVATDILARLRRDAYARRTAVLPNDTLVPTWPATPVNRAALTAAAKWTLDNELKSYRVTNEGIELFVMTPQVMAWRSEEVRNRIASASVMAINDSQPRLVDAIQRWREWDAYVAERRAVVVLNAGPAAAGYGVLTARSAIRDLGRGDVVSMQLLRGDTLVKPIDAAIIPAVVNPEAYRGARQPVYNAGVASYHPREFARRRDRTFPAFALVIQDGRARRSTRIAIPQAALEAIERDLASYQR
jgi:hypothetical protein